MSEFKNKLYKMYELYFTEGDASFNEWMILHAESEHKKSVKMAGDLGAAFGKISNLEMKAINPIRSEITYKNHDHMKIRWERDDQGMQETGELNFHWELDKGHYTLDTELLGMDTVIEIIKALSDEES